MAEMTVPLVALPGGLWGSPNPAWDHLIKRESSGRPHVIQEIRDVNSGGNEAEGLFQITPKTWDRHSGRDFAPSARHATPQQQAIVAARIIQRNPSGSDWGAGRPGRESGAALVAGLVPVGAPAAPAPPPPPRPVEPYGMPRGSNSGGYGGGGVRFPQWVYDLGNAFGVKPSTYPGHQESDRNEAGFAPNPQRLNRGIDWAAPGAPDEVDRMQRFADYLMSIRGELEQIIWENPRTGRRIGVAGGRDVTNSPYYNYDGGYNAHRNHVHSRHSHSVRPPGGAPPRPPAPAVPKPAYTEITMFNGRKNSSVRSRPPINFFIHTQEGPPGREITNASAKDLALYCQGQNGVSYHYTIRDGIVYCPVDTDFYSWSVLSANVFSINLCFAGSSVKLTRQQWLEKYGRDIDIAAYLAVQDARKYGFSTEVLVPDWARSGGDVYAGGPRPGISDHNYVTRELGIGDHQDVGRNFPWDVFVAAVRKYANNVVGPDAEEDDMFTDADRAKLDKLLAEYNPDRRAPSRSFFAMDQIWGETPLGFEWNIDGNVNEIYMTFGYLLGVKSIEEVVEFVAANGVAPTSWAGSQLDSAGKRWLAEVGQQWCQGLVAFRKRLFAKLTEVQAQAPRSVQELNTADRPAVDVADYERRLARATEELAAAQQRANTLEAENAKMRSALAEVKQAPATIELAAQPVQQTETQVADKPTDTAQQIADLYRAVQQLDLSSSLDIKDRAALNATIRILETKNGSQLS